MKLIVFALKEEDDTPEYEGYKKIYTGIGKINAAYNITKAIAQYKPDLVINFGTAGGVSLKKGDFVRCYSFKQLDMKCAALGYEKYITPYEDCNFLYKKPIIGSSDEFLNYKNYDVDLVDMESYALKKICYFENINFLCYKYITDECDSLSTTDWKKNLKDANKFYREVIEEYENTCNWRRV